MRYFAHWDAETIGEWFHVPPRDLTEEDHPDLLAMALGATLYLPAVRENLAVDVVRRHGDGIMSMVCCLEDAVRDSELPSAEAHLVTQLQVLAEEWDLRSRQGPLLFVRVREASQIYRLAEGLGPAVGVLTGFVLPKFQSDERCRAGLRAVAEIGNGLKVMPIMESQAVAHAETRLGTLLEAREVLRAHRDRVLAVRVGATDLSGVFGLRRPMGSSVWELGVVASALTDILNVFTRQDGSGFVVTGPVFEYFDQDLSRVGWPGRSPATGGLIREVLADLANGMLGKTIIHPSQAMVVNSLLTVSHEDYCDAEAICLETDATGGVARSGYGNKMNEVRPHRAWAERVLNRAAVFGVLAPGVGPIDLVQLASHRNRALV